MLRRIRAIVTTGWATIARRRLIGVGARLPPPLRGRLRRMAGLMRADMRDIDQAYPAWIDRYDRIDADARLAMTTRIASIDQPPLISVLMPTFNPAPRHLLAAIQSVQAQIYPRWELCIADDASTDPAIAPLLRAAQGADSRIRLTWRERNGHISAATNSALTSQRDRLSLCWTTTTCWHRMPCMRSRSTLLTGRRRILLYSDEDRIDEAGRRSTPYFKPDWDPDLMLGQNLVNHLGVYRRSLVERLGGFRLGMEGSQDYDLALRALAETAPDQIVHIPRVLYHWRQGGGGRSFSESTIERCVRNARRAVEEFLAPSVPGAVVQPAPATPLWNRVIYPVPKPNHWSLSLFPREIKRMSFPEQWLGCFIGPIIRLWKC